MCGLSDKEYIFEKYNIYSISFSTINNRHVKTTIIYNDHKEEDILISRTFKYTKDFLRDIQSLYFLFTSESGRKKNERRKII